MALAANKLALSFELREHLPQATPDKSESSMWTCRLIVEEEQEEVLLRRRFSSSRSLLSDRA
eukprot:3446336-Amphidinium_carterae.1